MNKLSLGTIAIVMLAQCGSAIAYTNQWKRAQVTMQGLIEAGSP
jgi:hypothetical protein